MVSQVVFMGVVFVLVKGYPISTNFVAGKRLVMLILFLFFIAYMAVFIWWEAGRDPAQVYHVFVIYQFINPCIVCTYMIQQQAMFSLHSE